MSALCSDSVLCTDYWERCGGGEVQLAEQPRLAASLVGVSVRSRVSKAGDPPLSHSSFAPLDTSAILSLPSNSSTCHCYFSRSFYIRLACFATHTPTMASPPRKHLRHTYMRRRWLLMQRRTLDRAHSAAQDRTSGHACWHERGCWSKTRRCRHQCWRYRCHRWRGLHTRCA